MGVEEGSDAAAAVAAAGGAGRGAGAAAPGARTGTEEEDEDKDDDEEEEAAPAATDPLEVGCERTAAAAAGDPELLEFAAAPNRARRAARMSSAPTAAAEPVALPAPENALAGGDACALYLITEDFSSEGFAPFISCTLFDFM